MQHLNPNRAPGVDGFNGAFYKSAWGIIDEDLLEAINNFLRSSKLLNQVNHTLICLVPKKTVLAMSDDYWPISLCNVVYRILSKLLANQLKPLLPRMIDLNQTVFIQGRRISDSILLAHELCHKLHSNQGRPRMCIKLDLRKAFDSINRHFICDAMDRFGFDPRWVLWIQRCMNPTFVLLINGTRSSSLSSVNGLRQGDPISPYLFVLAMQVLTSMFKKAKCNNELDPFSCGEISVSHIVFADDLMVFLRADKRNARRLKLLLDEFSSLSGLKINYHKSEIFFGGAS